MSCSGKRVCSSSKQGCRRLSNKPERPHSRHIPDLEEQVRQGKQRVEHSDESDVTSFNKITLVGKSKKSQSNKQSHRRWRCPEVRHQQRQTTLISCKKAAECQQKPGRDSRRVDLVEDTSTKSEDEESSPASKKSVRKAPEAPQKKPKIFSKSREEVIESLQTAKETFVNRYGVTEKVVKSPLEIYHVNKDGVSMKQFDHKLKLGFVVDGQPMFLVYDLRLNTDNEDPKILFKGAWLDSVPLK